MLFALHLGLGQFLYLVRLGTVFLNVASRSGNPNSACISCLGGDYDGDRSMDELKLLYRAYVTDSLSMGILEENKVNKDWLVYIFFTL